MKYGWKERRNWESRGRGREVFAGTGAIEDDSEDVFKIGQTVI